MSTDPPKSPFLDPEAYFGDDYLDPTLTGVSDLFLNSNNNLSQSTSSSSSFSTGTSSVVHNGYNNDQPLANTNFQNQMVSDLATPSNVLYHQTYAPWANQTYPTLANPYSQAHSQMTLANQTLVNPYLQMPNEMLPLGDQRVPLANQTLVNPYLHMPDEMSPLGNQRVPLANQTLVNPYLQMPDEMLPLGNQRVPLANQTMVNPHLQMPNDILPLENQPNVRIRNPRREEQLQRYFAKKHIRKLGKRVLYESRRKTAITKRRMRGRFVKDGDEFDYDPTANNT